MWLRDLQIVLPERTIERGALHIEGACIAAIVECREAFGQVFEQPGIGRSKAFRLLELPHNVERLRQMLARVFAGFGHAQVRDGQIGPPQRTGGITLDEALV